MSQVLEDLVDLLTLEPIEENLFRGRSQDLGFRQLFGGQVLGQSLSADGVAILNADDAYLPVWTAMAGSRRIIRFLLKKASTPHGAIRSSL